MNDPTTDPIDADEPEGTLTGLYGVLADERRRRVVSVLARGSTPVDIETVARSVATRGTDGGKRDEGRVERVRASLYHRHLPKLDDEGILEFDPDDRLVVDVADERLPHVDG